MEVTKVTIIGLGAVGGSLGLALKNYNPDFIVTGIDKGSIIIRAKDLEAIDNGCLYSELEEGVKDADVIFISTSIRVIKEIIPKLAGFVKPDAIITDTGMTKVQISRVAESSFNDRGHFIGGHPIIGFKKGGIEFADPYMFSNINYILTTYKKDEYVRTVEELIRGIGANPILMKPEMHDKLMGELNSILQVISISHVNSVFSELDDEELAMAIALGGRRFKRFSEALLIEPYYWEEVLSSNIDVIKTYAERFIKEFKSTVDKLDSESFYDIYEKARAYISKIPQVRKGFQSRLSYLYVTIEDKPGSIARLTSIIAEKGFDIRDIEVVKIKEGEGVLIKVAFKSQGIASKVGRVLMEEGYNYTTHISYDIDGIF